MKNFRLALKKLYKALKLEKEAEEQNEKMLGNPEDVSTFNAQADSAWQDVLNAFYSLHLDQRERCRKKFKEAEEAAAAGARR